MKDFAKEYKKNVIDVWEKLAKEGHSGAQHNLGFAYNNGHGVPQNYQKAYYWFSLAAANGNTAAEKWRDEVVEKMTPQQIAKAQEEVQKWFDEHQK